MLTKSAGLYLRPVPLLHAVRMGGEREGGPRSNRSSLPKATRRVERAARVQKHARQSVTLLVKTEVTEHNPAVKFTLPFA